MPTDARRDKDLQTFLHGELQAIVKKTGADYGFIGVVSYRAGARHIVIRDRFTRSQGAEAGDFRTARASFKVGSYDLEANDRSFVGHVAAIGEARYAPDVSVEPFYHPGIAATHSEHAIPVKLDDDVLAVLNLESRHLDGFPARVRRLAEEWARTIAARLYQEMVRAGLRRSVRTAPADGTDDAVRLVSTLRRLLDKLSRALVELRAAGAPAGDPEAAAPRPEACGAAPVGAGPVTDLRVQTVRSAAAGRRSQAADPARRGSGAGMYSVAGGSPVPAYVAESVSGVAPTAERMCARGSVVLSSTCHRTD